MNEKYYFLVGLLAIFLLNGCKTQRVLEIKIPYQEECLAVLNYSPYDMPIPLTELKLSQNLITYFDQRSLTIANAMGIMDDLDLLLGYNQKENDNSTVFIQTLQKIQAKVTKTNLEISSITSAIDCEEEKAEQLSVFLERRLRKSERNLTVGAIVTGALVGLSTGTILMAGGSGFIIEAIGISGGLAEVFLGLKILKLENMVFIQHPRNILADVKESKSYSDYLPPAIWYYLNHQNTSRNGTTLRELLLQRWEAYSDSIGEKEVYFLKEGYYTTDMLKNRADMLDQLEAQIGLMNQDILHFVIQLEELINLHQGIPG
ncbi:hypothetical protein [Negadavirga shengliensis]|uniref:Uncharacterized protein n=1 Tax=Negadavirga shengliensis TaxID=1389218 RepID=A0ABV9T6D6_9BACT